MTSVGQGVLVESAHALLWPHVQRHFLATCATYGTRCVCVCDVSITKDDRTIKLKPTQLSTETMGKVSADSIFLIGDDGTVATAEDGNFNLI